MQFIDTSISAVKIVKPNKTADDRGYFSRAFCAREFAEAGLMDLFVQCNMSGSTRAGTLRGIHYQTGSHAEAKFVRCVKGAVFDVAVDLDPDSPTYLEYVGVELSEGNAWGLYVPPTCAHAYQTLEDDSVVYYHVSAFYTPDAERGLRHDDPRLAIDWPMAVAEMSDKDRDWPLLEE